MTRFVVEDQKGNVLSSSEDKKDAILQARKKQPAGTLIGTKLVNDEEVCGFFVGPLPAMLTALITPLLSGAVTGMPPFFPPVAVWMAIELTAMAAVIAAVRTKWPYVNEWIILVPTLALGRVLHVALVYAFSLAIELPAAIMAGLSFLSGWPGLVLIIVAVPLIAKAGRAVQRRDPPAPESIPHA